MDWEKRDGDKRPYRFEAYYELETWKATISACDPENPNPFEDRNMVGAALFAQSKACPKGTDATSPSERRQRRPLA